MALLDELETTSDREALASLVEDLYLADQDYRRAFEAQWAENLAFYAGEHYVQLVTSDGTVRRMPSPTGAAGYVPRPKTNYTLKIVRALVANFLKSDPKTMVRPRGNDDRNVTAARLAEKVDEALDELQCWDEKQVELVNWMVTCGVGFRKDYIDATEAAKMVLPRSPYVQTPDGQVVPGADGAPMEVEPERSATPYVAQCEVLSPFQFAVDPLATRLDNARWVMELSVHPIEWLKEQFAATDATGAKREGMTGEAENLEGGLGRVSPGLLYWIQLKNANQTRLSRFKSMAVVKEYYQAPTVKHPAGRCLVVADGKLLFEGPSPYAPKFWHPYTMFPFLLMPGRFWPLSAVEFLVPSQRRLNSIDAIQMYTRNTTIAPRWAFPKGSGISRDKMTGVPGQILEYNATGGQPVLLDGKGLPPDVQNERQATIRDMEEIGGTFNILGGDREEGVPSYSGLAFLQENASDVHLPTFRLWEKALERASSRRLWLVSKFYTQNLPELTALLRDKLAQTSDMELSQFTGNDLLDNCDVRIEAGTSIPRSRVLFQQTVMELLKNGMLAPVMQDPELYVQLLEIFGLSSFSGHKGEDVRKAQLENAIFLSFKKWQPTDVQTVQGPPDPMTGMPTPMLITPVTALFVPEEDHQVHLAAHLRLLKSPQSIANGPLYVQAIRSHIQQHQQVLMQQQMQMMAQQEMQPPAAGQEGGAQPQAAPSA